MRISSCVGAFWATVLAKDLETLATAARWQ